jgi:hypothetical protein
VTPQLLDGGHVDTVCEAFLRFESRLQVDAIAGTICRCARAGDGEYQALNSVRNAEW